MTIRPACLVLSLMAFLAAPVASEEEKGGNLRVEWFGYVSEEPAYFRLRRDTPVNPRSKILTFPEWENRVVGNLNTTIAYQALKLVTKFRPTIEIQPAKTDDAFPLDDLYLDFNLFKRAFVTVGVKNYRKALALHLIPLIFLPRRKSRISPNGRRSGELIEKGISLQELISF